MIETLESLASNADTLSNILHSMLSWLLKTLLLLCINVNSCTVYVYMSYESAPSHGSMLCWLMNNPAAYNIGTLW